MPLRSKKPLSIRTSYGYERLDGNENPGGDSHPLGIGGSTYRYAKEYWLVVEPTHLKNMLVKLDHETPRFGVKIKTI